MFDFNLQEIFQLLTLSLALISVVITFGIVWRVERRLDISYKFILLAIIVFSFGELIETLRTFNILEIGFWWPELIKGLFVVFFVIGILEMWRLIKDLEVQEIIKKIQKRKKGKI